MAEVVVTETKFPERIGANTERRGSVLCLTERIYITSVSLSNSYYDTGCSVGGSCHTSGSAPAAFATSPGSFLAARAFR